MTDRLGEALLDFAATPFPTVPDEQLAVIVAAARNWHTLTELAKTDNQLVNLKWLVDALTDTPTGDT